MKDRVYWIDYLKAFAIFLVVFGHSGLDNDSFFKTWIYGFHMPLFVFVSGFFAHKQKSLLSAFMKDVKTLYIPYLFFSLFLIPFYIVINHLTGVAQGNSNILVSIGQKLLMDDYYHCGPIWFLGALLVIKNLYNSLYQTFSLYGGGIIAATISLFLLHVLCDVHVFSIDTALALFPYYIAGSFCPQVIDVCKKMRTTILFAVLGIIIYSTISIANGCVDYDQMKLGQNVLMTYASGLIGCFSTTLLFSLLFQYHNLLLANIGMNTLTILGFHSVFIQIFRFAYKIIVSNTLPLWYLVAISIITLFLCYWISKLLMKYCPTAIGRTSAHN